MNALVKLGDVAFKGEQPWKSNGVSVEDGASLKDWQKAAGLDYEVLPVPSQYQWNGELKTVPNRVQLVRSDTGASLSEMSGKSYKIRQPGEILEFFSELIDKNHLQMKVVGSMQEGRKIFALAERVGHEVEIGKGSRDFLKQNVMLIESFDGSHATKAIPKAIRLFCLNQITPASIKSLTGVSRKHSQDWDIQNVQLELATMDQAFLEYCEAAQQMLKFHMTEGDLLRFFSALYAPTAFENITNWRKSKFFLDKEHGVTTNQMNILADLVNDIVRDNPGEGPVSGSLYNALNAVTYYHDHEARTKGAKRFESAMIGAGERMKSKALRHAIEIVADTTISDDEVSEVLEGELIDA